LLATARVAESGLNAIEFAAPLASVTIGRVNGRAWLRCIQRRPDLINAFTGQTGPILDSSPPWTLAFQDL
jgi:hypothetical protein